MTCQAAIIFQVWTYDCDLKMKDTSHQVTAALVGNGMLADEGRSTKSHLGVSRE